ncbi:MAG: phosphotransferase [Candidatus Saccharimonas sp.]|nr:phosphotransferase [Candidatus Saccharimonas sp.]
MNFERIPFNVAEYNPIFELTPVAGGHMNYVRAIATLASGEQYFIKHHDDARFDDVVRARHSRAYLHKEHALYRLLEKQSFAYIPSGARLHNKQTLLLEPLSLEKGWHWRAPKDNELRERYITDVLDAVASLEQSSIQSLPSFEPDINETAPVLVLEGWDRYIEHEEAIRAELRAVGTADAAALSAALSDLYLRHHITPAGELKSFSHHDLRQSNLAWHPEYGVKIVDWSWAGLGTKKADSTSFLIDLAKSDIDVTPYMGEFDEFHALRLIGFWLEHSTWPTSDGSTTVRKHQLASAITAHRLYQYVQNKNHPS